MWFGCHEQRKFSCEASDFRRNFCDKTPTLTVQTSGSTGQPQPLRVEKQRMLRSAEATLRFLRIPADATALLCLPLKFIAGQMMVVRSLVGPLHLRAVCPSSRPLASLRDAPFFAAMTPMQVFESLRSPHDRRLLRRIRCLLIGGGAIPPSLEAELHLLPNEVWSSYGMTETLSHIALRRLNGSEASTTYRPLPGVRLSLSSEETLVIDAPGITEGSLTTNDLAEILPDGSFRILGRRDNVICSGGLKLRIEELETGLASLPVHFLVTSLPDERLGESVTLLFEPCEGITPETLDRLCRRLLPPHAVPRRFVAVPHLPFTDTGKPARAEAKRLTREFSQSADF
ncbi:MAG: AMP-binding protein [Alloprevotella sp.]